MKRRRHPRLGQRHWWRNVVAAAIIAVVGLSSAVACNGETNVPRSSVQPTPLTSSETENITASDPGVSGKRVLFGQSAAFSGPAQQLGKGMRLGIEAAFDEVNQQGGVNGRLFALRYFDDAYEPEAAIVNTQRLIEEEKVFALIGEVGTPTSRSATPVAAEANVPFIAPFTGAEFLRDKKWNNILNMRSSYYQETEEMVDRLTNDLNIDRIAVMYQDDSYGRAGYRGVKLALERRQMEPVSIGLYPRNTTAIKTALLDLMQGQPQAVIMIGAYEPVASLILWARQTALDAVFMTVSFVGSNALAKELGANGEGVYVTQVVPFPTDDSRAVTQAYLKALEAYSPGRTPGFVSFEGYLAGRLAIAGVRGCGQEVNRTCFLETLRQADVVDIDGFELRYGKDDNQGSDQVFLTRIGTDGAYHPVTSLLDVRP